MFDIGVQEILLIAVVAIIVIGPKDMPLALRTAGRWIGKLRRMSGHFRTGLDSMIREAELDDMEKKWAAQNEKVMAEHPEGVPDEMEPTGAYPAARSDDAAGAEAGAEAGNKKKALSPEDALSDAGARPAGTTDGAAKKAAQKAAHQAKVAAAKEASSDSTAESAAAATPDAAAPDGAIDAKPASKAAD